MKKILVAASVMLAIFVSGCSLTIESKPSEGTSPAPSETVVPETNDVPDSSGLSNEEQAFVETVRQQYPAATGSDQELLDAGYGVCSLLNTMTPVQVIQGLVNEGIEPQLAGFIMGAGSVALCPEHQNKVQGFVDRFASPGV